MRSSIESLEPRIAPASLTGRVLKYTDVDGDQVTVTFTKGTLATGNFKFDTAFGSAGAQQLQRIDVSGVADLETSNITVAVKRAPGGDGLANIGEIIATGRDLGTVKMSGNLGKIEAGNNALPPPGVKSLTIGSYGILKGTTQPMGGNQSSTITGAVSTFTILGDFGGGALSVSSVGTLKIGGSIVGGTASSEGRFIINGDLTKGTIGSIVGGTGSLAGQLDIGGDVGSLTLRGSLLGGAPMSDTTVGQLNIDGSVKTLTILGEVRGLSGTGKQDSIQIDGTVGSLTIGGNVTSTGASDVVISLANDVNLPGVAVGTVLIKGSTQGMLLGAGLRLGSGSPVTASSITINGSCLQSRIVIGADDGGDNLHGTFDDALNAASVLSKLVIKGPIFGTVGGTDYFGILAGKIASATINGRAVPVAIGGQNLSVALSGDVFVKDAV